MAYYAIWSWRQAIKYCSHGFVVNVWFYISEERVIAGQMPKCYNILAQAVLSYYPWCHLGIMFENVFSTVWFFPLTFTFLNPEYQHNKPRDDNRGNPSLFCLTHKHTPCCFMPRLPPDSFLPVSLRSIFVSPEPWLNTMSTCIIQYVSNGVCVLAVALRWVWNVKIWRYTDRWRPSSTRWSPLMAG